MFLLSLFGLVASGMLMAKYRDQNDTTSTGYKYTIFSLVFFIVAVLGTLIAGALSMRSPSAPVPVGQPVAVTAGGQVVPKPGVLTKLTNLNQKLS